MKHKVYWAVVAVVAVFALGFAALSSGGDETSREDRLAGEIRCPTCAGLSVAESTSPLAEFSQDEIERRVADGETDEQIRAYFVSRYGAEALLSPEPEGVGLIAWAAPVVFGIAAILGATLTISRWRKRTVPVDDPVLDLAEVSETTEIIDVPTKRTSRRRLTIGVLVVFSGVAVAAVYNTTGERNDRTPDELLAEASQDQATGQATEALKKYDQVLQLEPENATALAYRGWLLNLAGYPDEGFDSLTRALEEDPSFAEAHLFRGIILLRTRQDAAGATVEIEAYLASNPPEPGLSLGRQILDDAGNQAG